ncbi:amidase family protein [Streptomyces antimycoticus]|nr:amidase family protein [Streptomyces antimycoticus]
MRRAMMPFQQPVSEIEGCANVHRPAGSRSLTVEGVEQSFFDQTGWANLTSHVGLPSLVMPFARSAEGLPIGAQLVGPAHADRSLSLLALAERLAPLLRGTAEGVIAPWSG